MVVARHISVTEQSGPQYKRGRERGKNDVTNGHSPFTLKTERAPFQCLDRATAKLVWYTRMLRRPKMKLREV